MGDRKDKELGKAKEALEKEDAGVALPAEGRVRNLPPSPTEGGGSSAAAAERKVERGRRQEVEDPAKKEDVSHDGGGGKVKNRVKVSSAAKASLVSEAGMEGGEETSTRSLSLCLEQPHLVEKGVVQVHQPKKVEGAVGSLGEASSSSVMSTPAASSVSESRNGSSQQFAEEEAHPCLGIDNVLEVIFKHIVDRPGLRFRKNVAEDIQSIRLVCQTWKDEGTRAYRRYGPGPVATFSEYDQASQNSGRKSLAAFMDTMKSSPMIPVQKFVFRGSTFRQENLKLFRDFLLLCGPEVVSLELSIDSSDAGRIMSNLKNLPILNLLKLRALKLIMGVVVADDDDEEVEVKANQVQETVNLVQLLLTAAKGLRELDLSCSCFPYYGGSDYRRRQVIVILMEKLGRIIATGIPKTVRQLKLYMRINESTFNQLAKVRLQLERFEFGVPSGVERRTLYEFLQSQASTLKHFRFWDGGHQHLVFMEFPRLPELLKLELNDVVVIVAAHSDFATTFPKLHYLNIAGMKTEVALHELLSIVQASSLTLKILHLPVWGWSRSLAPFIRDVALSFPCLLELHITLNHGSQETLQEVFTYFNQLEALNIWFKEQIRQIGWADSLLSGISGHDCYVLYQLQDFGNVNLDEFQRQPSLLNLTKLKRLCLRNLAYSFVATDFLAHFVFLEMASLREIHLANSRFSPKYMGLLRNRLIMRKSSV